MIILQEGLRILEFISRAFLHILPYFLLSIVIAAGINQFNFKGKMVEFMRKKAAFAIVIATLIGAASPLCSCGVIPTLFAFLQIGVPLAPIMSFWITSPVMSPEAFLITWGNLGPELALARLFATILMGVVSGFITLKLFPPKSTSAGFLKLSLGQNTAACGCKAESPPKLLSLNPVGSSKWIKFLKDLKKITLFLGAWLIVAFLLESIIIFYFPHYLIKSLFGQQNGFSVVWAALIGIPLYVNNISAIPIVSGLIQEGMSKGSALAFLLAGPVTAIPAMIAVFGLVKRKVFLLFLLLGLSLSIVFGYLYEFISLFWK